MSNIKATLKTASKDDGYCFVLDADGQKLDPTRQEKAWHQIRHEKADLVRLYPMTIRLKKIIPREKINTDPVHLGIDDGAKFVGLALVQKCATKNKVLLKAVIEHRQDVSHLMEVRKGYRRYRRAQKRYRPVRFDNRGNSRKAGRIPPSIRQKKQAIVRVAREILNFVRINRISLEDTAFDIRAMTDGYKPYRWQYQKSNRLDENIRKAVIIRDNNKCALCGKGNCALEAHHITPRRENGSNTPANLITLCKKCHEIISKDETAYTEKLYGIISGRNISGLLYAQHVMQGKAWLRSQLSEFASLELTDGGTTANRRIDWNLEKTHSNDAICCTGLKPDNWSMPPVWRIKPMRRKSKARTESVVNFRHRDIVSYTDQKGKTYTGYITALYPDKQQLNFQAPEKHLKRVNVRKCKMVWRFNKIYWFDECWQAFSG